MIVVREAREADLDAWRPLWDGYNAFYGRAGETALAEEVTRETWRRFFDPAQRVFALVVQRLHRLFARAVARAGPSDFRASVARPRGPGTA